MSKKADLDNHSRQLDPRQDPYWQSRGYPAAPSQPTSTEPAPPQAPPPPPKKT